ncbi:MAG: hypothetical protein HY238_12950 [Acidobacteria bacterium]|nr:hypothetical protein [Acidobacteriota bacterium]
MALRNPGGRALSIGCLAALLAGSAWAHAPHLVLSRKYLNFVAAPGGNNPPLQPVKLENSTHGRMVWTATVAVVTPSGGNWLAVDPPVGMLPGLVDDESGIVIVSVVSKNLAAGVYYGTITISAPGDTGADNTPQVIEVALTVTSSGQAAPGIAVAPDALAFEGVAGSGRSYNLSVNVINAGGGTLNWSATAETTSGGNWLSVVQVNASTAAITARVGDLARGSYSGRVVISAPGAANPTKVIPVIFAVRDPRPPVILSIPTSLSFATFSDAGSPPPQALSVSNGGEGTLNWRIEATTFNGGAWLQVTAPGPSGTATVSAELGSLGAGTYAGRLTIIAEGATNSPVQVPVTFTVRPPQVTFERSTVVNAASFQPQSLAPGEIVSIFGSRLGPREGAVFALDPATQKIPTTLAGTTVTFDGVRAPLYYVSYNQVNLQVPFEVADKGSVRMVVTATGVEPGETTVSIVEAAPGIFTVGDNRAAALNQDFTLNSPDNPADAGSVIQLFITGQGVLDTKVETGALAPVAPPFPKPVLRVAVNIGGFEAKVLFAGLAPGFVGLTQINVEVPRGAGPTNQARVVVGFGFNQTLTPAFVAVR